jgi:hypothetical protein|nr:MAG TPA: hypothetical protein [Caudoviricetes sp.]
MSTGEWIMRAIEMVALLYVSKVIIKDLIDVWKNR